MKTVIQYTHLRSRFLHIFLFVLSLLFSSGVHCQNLINSRTTSYYTYTYKITNEEAEKIYTEDEIESSMFHTLLDSCPTDSTYISELAPGHYLKTFAEKDIQKYYLLSVAELDVFVLNNYTDLCIRVCDQKGGTISDAMVILGSKTLKFDSLTQLYKDKKSGRMGILKVSWKGITSFYEVEKEFGRSRIVRTGINILWKSPLKYIWRPVYFLGRLPYDGIRSIVHSNYYGSSIYRINYFFKKSYNNISCLLSGNNCNVYSKKYNGGYFVFNKPKYQPEDTVRFKAFVLDEKGRPLNKKIAVIIDVKNKPVKLAELMPYTKGGYEFAFVLHDSLKLSLDERYHISLESIRTDKSYTVGGFDYEDYELTNNDLIIRTEGSDHYKSQDFTFFIKGVDENDLSLMDGRVQILVKPSKVSECLLDQIFVADTLLFLEKQLNSEEETEIIVTDSDFPAANFNYEIDVRLLTSDNESITKTISVNYKGEEEIFKIEDLNDSLRFNLMKNGTSANKHITISGIDKESKKIKLYEGKNPVTISLNPFFDYFTAESGTLTDFYYLPEDESQLRCFKRRTPDSLLIVMDNPRQIPFTYELYRRNKRVAGGYTTSLNYREKVSQVKNYLICLRYLWAGEVIEEKYQIPYFNKMLNIEVDQPDLVFPGQKAKIDLLVKDLKGNPVKNVDITAYSITKKFKSPIPEVPYHGKQRKLKPYLNKYEILSLNQSNSLMRLNYQAWKTLAGIDSIEFYKFIYPENELYRFEYYTSDSITQLAPFVVNNGHSIPVDIIYIDSKPVYFSWSTNDPPYSFMTSPGYHNVILRTAFHNIKIDSLYIPGGKKLIISLEVKIKNKNIKIEKAEPKLSDLEKHVLYPYIIPYKNTFDDQLVFLKDEENLQLLNTRESQWGTSFAGPFAGNLTFNILNGNSIRFKHEPFFEYEFGDRVIKMRTFERSRYPFMFYSGKSHTDNLDARCLTKKTIDEIWQQQIDTKRSSFGRFENPSSTTSGHGKLRLNYHFTGSDKQPLNVLLLKNNDEEFIRVYPGNTVLLHQLEKGYYKVILFFSGSRYHLEDSVFVSLNGTTYRQIMIPELLQKDEFSAKFSELISKVIFIPFKGTNDPKRALNEMYNAYQSKSTFSGEGRVITGYVYDEDTNEPIPGVTIQISGTNYGTTSDINGQYSINVPLANDQLVFAYIGYEPLMQKINYDNFLSIKLKSSELELEGVVVTSLAISKTSLSKAYSTFTINEEYAELPFVESLAAKVGGVSVAGVSTQLNENITVNDIMKDTRVEDLQDLYYTSLNPGSIRKNFSDYAFWQPKITTDHEGKASFEVTFPGDITNWQTHYLAMNSKRQSGQLNKTIRSYKPLMAQLAVPRFLIEKDSTKIIGKVFNYLKDSSLVTTSFFVNDELKSNVTRNCNTSLIDTLSVYANDTISLSYTISKSDGYKDGEVRNIPILPAGLEETKGNFFLLENDTSLNIGFQAELGDVQFYASTDYLEVLEDEIDYLANYKYECNEQLASKLKALIAGKRIALYRKEDFRYERDIKKIINLISRTQKRNGYWGWWKDSEESEWISLHVLEALLEAKNLGYPVLNITPAQILIRRFADCKDTDNKIRLVKMMDLAGSEVDYKIYLDNLIKSKNLSLNNLLQIIELRQKHELPYDLKSVFQYQRNTMFGNIYFSDTISKQNLYSNDIQNTLLVYKIMKSDSTSHDALLNKMRNYFFETRRDSYWGNTYESSRIIETILPDMLARGEQINRSELQIEGPFSKKVIDFPYTTTFKASDSLKIVKKGSNPVYLTTYQRLWNKNPNVKNTDFEIVTRFKEETSSSLKGAKQVTLIADVKVIKDADYVMINIPIPAGCSYVNKDPGAYPEIHREYYKNETTIFCEQLQKGNYSFEVNLLPRYSGSYTMNPAKIELMYYPTFNANNGISKVRIN